MVTAVVDDVLLQERIRAVPDPEIPVISLDDLGVIREVTIEPDRVRVVMTPTYSGCPAMEAMAKSVSDIIRSAGREPDVVTQLNPAWTTDWMSDAGKAKLAEFGIAPPGPVAGRTVGLVLGRRSVSCPVCGSQDTEEISRFGATACKALRRCRSCGEPFEEFKPL